MPQKSVGFWFFIWLNSNFQLRVPSAGQQLKSHFSPFNLSWAFWIFPAHACV